MTDEAPEVQPAQVYPIIADLATVDLLLDLVADYQIMLKDRAFSRTKPLAQGAYEHSHNEYQRCEKLRKELQEKRNACT